MITLTGMLDLNNGKAPAVTLRIGDTMRQTELTVDNEVDLSECTAELYMVKPDSTFVIAACTITEDNSIIVSWPEQAAAVKGLGEYCILISNIDDDGIFSARGPVWIDDHVITEDMIESVAEVNGYTFPDDFATKDDITAVIDDDTISEDKTWSSSKINEAILENYDNTEKVIGTWFNKPLYSKSAILSASDIHNGDYQKYMDIMADNSDMVIVPCLYLINSYNELMPLPYVNTTSIYCGYFIERLTDRIRFQLRYGGSYPSGGFQGAIISVKYTKTTD